VSRARRDLVRTRDELLVRSVRAHHAVGRVPGRHRGGVRGCPCSTTALALRDSQQLRGAPADGLGGGDQAFGPARVFGVEVGDGRRSLEREPRVSERTAETLTS